MSIYDVTITAMTGAAPADGFIDPRTSYSYMDTDGDAPNSLANAKAKMRANRRYKFLLQQIGRMTNAYVVSYTAAGAGADAAASSFVIRLDIEHGDDSLVTEDESNVGQKLTGAAAIKRCVARACLLGGERNVEYFDPTVVPGRQIDGAANAGIARGPVINIETIGPLTNSLPTAEAAITVVKIS